MITQPITVTLRGTPAPKGSMKCIGSSGRHQLVEQLSKTIRPWRAKLNDAFKLIQSTPAPKGQPIGVEVTLIIDRPKHHFGTGRNARILRAGAPTYPTGHGTGDVDKHARTILDSLQAAGVLDDDCQVVELVARKAYPCDPSIPSAPDHPGARVRIYPIADPQVLS